MARRRVSPVSSVSGVGVSAGRDITGPVTVVSEIAEHGRSPHVSVTPPFNLLPKSVRGRSAIVDEIVAAVRRRGAGRLASPTPEPIWLLHGLGGVGKSTIALEVARRAKDLPAQVFWVDATDRSAVQAAMWSVARLLSGPDSNLYASPTAVGAVDVVWEVLDASPANWLIVLDNADDPQALAADGHRTDAGNGWLRCSTRGVVVVTSRVGEPSAWGRSVTDRSVGTLAAAAAGQVLLDLADQRRKGTVGSRPEAEQLAARLDCLPLALRAAGRYLAVSVERGDRATFDSYRATLSEGFGRLIDEGTRRGVTVGVGEPTPRELVMTTWNLSLDWLAEQGYPEAKSLVWLMSCFAPAPIPFSLIDAAVDLLPGLTRERTRQVLSALRSLALVDDRSGPNRPGPDPGGARQEWVTLHPLVQQTMRDATPDARHLRAAAIHAVVTALAPPAAPDGRAGNAAPDELATRRAIESVEPHLRHIAAAIVADPRSYPRRLTRMVEGVLLDVSSHLDRNASSDAAVDALRIYFALAVTLRGKRSALSRKILHKIGHELWWLGRHDEARTALRTSSPGLLRLFLLVDEQMLLVRCGLTAPQDEPEPQRESLLGALRFLRLFSFRKGTSFLTARRKLADALASLNESTEAEAEYRTVLKTQSETLGDSDPATLTTRLRLAGLMSDRGNLAEAEAEYRMVVDTRARVLGPHDTATLAARRALAELLRRAGNLQDAEAEYRMVLAGERRVLGNHDPMALATRRDFIALLRDVGRDAEAETEFRAVLRAQRRVLGKDDETTLDTHEAFAGFLESAQRHPEAEGQYREVLRRRRRLLGNGDTATLHTQYKLARVLYEAGRHAEAEREHRAVLESRVRALDPKDPNSPNDVDVADSRHQLAKALLKLDRPLDAAAELRAAIDARTRALGPDHPKTLAGRHELAHALAASRDKPAAIAELRQVIEITPPAPGGVDPAALQDRHCLSKILTDSGRSAEAVTELRSVLDGLPETMGPDDPTVLDLRNTLGRSLARLKRFAEAEEHFRDVLEIRRRVLGESHPKTLITWHNLAHVRAFMVDDPGSAEADLRQILQAQRAAREVKETEALFTQGCLATALWRQGRLDEAEAEFRSVIAGRRKLRKVRDPRLVATRLELAELLVERGRLEDADTEYAAALKGHADDGSMLLARFNHASVQSELGRRQEAVDGYRSVLDVERSTLGDHHLSTLITWYTLASTLASMGRTEEAAQEYRAVLDGEIEALGDDDPSTAVTRFNLAGVLVELGRHDEAEQHYRRAWEIERRALGDDDPATTMTREDLAALLRTLGRADEADTLD